jgi:hypothetical protein
MDKDEFFLRRCSYMVGMNEAWVIEKYIYVSPAIFQLLTDNEDLDTMRLVATQLIVKPASYAELADLARTREGITASSPKKELNTFMSAFKSFF